MRIVEIVEQDNKFLQIQALIEQKRNMLLNKQKNIKEITKHNQFLDNVKSDYEKYYNYIAEQKKQQIQALELLNTYISDLTETGKITKHNIDDAKHEQGKIMNEVDEIKKKLDDMMNNTTEMTYKLDAHLKK
jgi:flagellar biosynthesis chaperone FliJ